MRKPMFIKIGDDFLNVDRIESVHFWPDGATVIVRHVGDDARRSGFAPRHRPIVTEDVLVLGEEEAGALRRLLTEPDAAGGCPALDIMAG